MWSVNRLSLVRPSLLIGSSSNIGMRSVAVVAVHEEGQVLGTLPELRWTRASAQSRSAVWPVRLPVDAVGYLIGLAELSDVGVDHLAGLLALVSAERLGRLQGLQFAQSQALSTRLTATGVRPATVSISLSGMRWRSGLAVRSITSGGVGLRSRLGRELRSCGPAKRSSS
jgi:hypothetical protein